MRGSISKFSDPLAAQSISMAAFGHDDQPDFRRETSHRKEKISVFQLLPYFAVKLPYFAQQ